MIGSDVSVCESSWVLGVGLARVMMSTERDSMGQGGHRKEDIDEAKAEKRAKHT